MKKIKKHPTLYTALFCVGLLAGVTQGDVKQANAETLTTTVESRVVAVPSEKTTTYNYKIYGPDKVEYTIEGPSQEVGRLAEEIRVNPNSVVKFEGNVVDGPSKVFHVTRWEKTTTSGLDSTGGETTTTRTETTTTH